MLEIFWNIYKSDFEQRMAGICVQDGETWILRIVLEKFKIIVAIFFDITEVQNGRPYFSYRLAIFPKSLLTTTKVEVFFYLLCRIDYSLPKFFDIWYRDVIYETFHMTSDIKIHGVRCGFPAGPEIGPAFQFTVCESNCPAKPAL